jgi:putative thioredoxin
MAVPATVSQWIINVDEATFQRDVIERSRQVPVVVDFWAIWCGPCRSLGPILESLAAEYAGRFVLAKLNVDENQRLAAQYNIQGIPAVKGFRNGQVASEFVGALPRPAVRQFIDKLVPNAQDTRVSEGLALVAAGKPSEAEKIFRSVVAEYPKHAGAQLGLARSLMEQGQSEAALRALDSVPPGTPEIHDASQLRMAIALRQAAGGASEPDLQGRIAAAPGDLNTRYQLASLQATQGRNQEALENFLEIVRRDRGSERNRARTAMLHIFEVLGEDPLARTYRNRLASLLFA